eukprot:GHVP01001515.1.p1 GENE.GHVP01001515.1~~GHVP01001515.1.p1  ORF type:complete len:1178 (+),score=225.58 GHVP01001515.1:1440-4973(+)
MEIRNSLIELEKRVELNPTDSEAHYMIIAQVRESQNPQRLRRVRERATRFVPLPEDLWIEWLHDEESSLSHPRKIEEVEELVSLQDRSVLLCPCAEVYGVKLKFARHLWHHEEFNHHMFSTEKVREIHEESVRELGCHFLEGPSIWELYRQFEIKVLNNLLKKQPNDDMSPDPTEAKLQCRRIRGIFSRQFRLGLLGMPAVLDEYHVFDAELPLNVRASEAELNEVLAAYREGQEEWHVRKHLEERVGDGATQENDMVAVKALEKSWDDYIDFEIQREEFWRIYATYHRACEELGTLKCDLWTRWASLCFDEKTRKKNPIEIFERAVLQMPTSVRLWTHYILCQSALGSSSQTISDLFVRCLEMCFGSVKYQPASSMHLLELALTTAEAIRLHRFDKVKSKTLEKTPSLHFDTLGSPALQGWVFEGHQGNEIDATTGFSIEGLSDILRFTTDGSFRQQFNSDGNDSLRSVFLKSHELLCRRLSSPDFSQEILKALYVLWLHWIKMETVIAKNVDNLQLVSRNLLASFPNSPSVWMAYASLFRILAAELDWNFNEPCEKLSGETPYEAISSIYREARSNQVMKDPHQLNIEWLFFEKEFGTPEAYRQAVQTMEQKSDMNVGGSSLSGTDSDLVMSKDLGLDVVRMAMDQLRTRRDKRRRKVSEGDVDALSDSSSSDSSNRCQQSPFTTHKRPKTDNVKCTVDVAPRPRREFMRSISPSPPVVCRESSRSRSPSPMGLLHASARSSQRKSGILAPNGQTLNPLVMDDLTQATWTGKESADPSLAPPVAPATVWSDVEMKDLKETQEKVVTVNDEPGKAPHLRHFIQKAVQGNPQLILPVCGSQEEVGSSREASTLFLTNLDRTVSTNNIKKFLEENQCLGVKDIRLVLDFRKISKGFAYVDFETPEQVLVAVKKLDGLSLNERNVKARRSEPTAPIYEPCVVFLKSVPSQTAVEEIRKFFSDRLPEDSIKDVRIKEDSSPNFKQIEGKETCHAYVEFVSPEITKDVLSWDTSEEFWSSGTHIQVFPSVPMKKHQWTVAPENKIRKKGLKEEKKSTSSVSGKTLLLNNLRFTTTAEKLKEHLESCLNIIPQRIHLATNEEGKSRGFAFVEFESKEDAFAAQMLNGNVLEGREICVSMSTREITEPGRKKETQKIPVIRKRNAGPRQKMNLARNQEGEKGV